MIDKLELLLALAKERHFGRAAEACGVTQPTMSTSLKQLEEILGVMLVQRGSRFQGFTPEGERTLDWARRIVGDARAMRQEINTLKVTVLSDDFTAAFRIPWFINCCHLPSLSEAYCQTDQNWNRSKYQ